MATFNDRFSIAAQLEHQQAKHVGTGHPDITKFEWGVNIHRDSYASYLGHHAMLQYFSVAENESVGRVAYNLQQRMLIPCGIPPERKDEA